MMRKKKLTRRDDYMRYVKKCAKRKVDPVSVLAWIFRIDLWKCKTRKEFERTVKIWYG